MMGMHWALCLLVYWTIIEGDLARKGVRLCMAGLACVLSTVIFHIKFAVRWFTISAILVA